MTRTQLAKELGISVETVRKYCKSNGINTPYRKQCQLSETEEMLLRDKIRDGMGRSFHTTCKLCGGKGHSARLCPNDTTPRRCRKCGKIKQYDDFYRIKSRGINNFRVSSICKECDNLRSKDRYVTLEGRASSLIYSIKGRAETSITVADIISLFGSQNGLCYYTKFEMTTDGGYYSFSIDRIDNGKGYTLDNIVLCCWIVNQMKREHSLEEFRNVCKAVARNEILDRAKHTVGTAQPRH